MFSDCKYPDITKSSPDVLLGVDWPVRGGDHSALLLENLQSCLWPVTAISSAVSPICCEVRHLFQGSGWKGPPSSWMPRSHQRWVSAGQSSSAEGKSTVQHVLQSRCSGYFRLCGCSYFKKAYPSHLVCAAAKHQKCHWKNQLHRLSRCYLKSEDPSPSSQQRKPDWIDKGCSTPPHGQLKHCYRLKKRKRPKLPNLATVQSSLPYVVANRGGHQHCKAKYQTRLDVEQPDNAGTTEKEGKHKCTRETQSDAKWSSVKGWLRTSRHASAHSAKAWNNQWTQCAVHSEKVHSRQRVGNTACWKALNAAPLTIAASFQMPAMQ